MFLRANFHRDSSRTEISEPVDVRHLQEAVTNFMTASHALWPFDFGPLVILRVLVEQRWGDIASSDTKARVALVSRFFNEVASENSGRAVRGEPPLDYEQVKAKWARCTEGFFPMQSALGGTQVVPTSAGGSGSGNNGNRSAQRPAQPAGRARPANTTPRAIHNGRLVCFNYNQRQGCTRQQASRDACKDSAGRSYAHYCNFYDKARGGFCLAMHPRCMNH